MEKHRFCLIVAVDYFKVEDGMGEDRGLMIVLKGEEAGERRRAKAEGWRMANGERGRKK